MSSSAGCAAAPPRLWRSHVPPGGRGANSGEPILSPSTRRRRAVVVAAKGAKEGDNGWMKGLEGIGGLLKRMPGVTIYQAAAPPPVLPGARVDFLEAMLQWHVGNSTSADLVLRDVQDAIVSEVTSFPVDKVALGESPSVAMHVPVPTLRQNPNGGPCNSQELGAAAMRMNEKRSSGGASGASASGTGLDEDSCDYASGEALVAGFPAWQGWTQPATALTLRAVLMTASALTAAAGMRQPVIGDPAKERSRAGLLKPQILFPEPTETLGDLREFFETLWPDAPYSFGTYGRDSVSSDDRYLKGDGVDEKKKLGRREKRLVIVVNVSSPGEESAAESDGEGMVNAAETLLELNVPFVVLTLWQDNSLVKSVQTKRARTEERDALRVLMERRTRILLGRSVRRKEARQKIRDAYARAVKMPQGKGYVALEEALAEAKAAGAEVGSEGDAMLAEIRSQARFAETDALAAALTSACLQVPVDVASLRANLQRARGVLEREEAEADEVAAKAAAAAASEGSCVTVPVTVASSDGGGGGGSKSSRPSSRTASPPPKSPKSSPGIPGSGSVPVRGLGGAGGEFITRPPPAAVVTVVTAASPAKPTSPYSSYSPPFIAAICASLRAKTRRSSSMVSWMRRSILASWMASSSALMRSCSFLIRTCSSRSLMS
mmetsp:Transcript_9328/g.42279  ORF Transcript_9328/g.42279 Transcript_9328/m.42279 type:complete len:663 (-) Transcript_9328:1311-3299(-)